MEENIINQNRENQPASGQANPGQDFDALLRDRDFQSEFDRRVSRALETARSKWAQETERRIEQARAETERLARMTGEERMAHDYAQREAALLEREQRIVRRELQAQAVKTLSERGLPAELAEAVSYESAEQMEQSIDAAERAFRAAVQFGVEQRMRGSVPAAAQASANREISDAEYYLRRYAPNPKNNNGG